MLFFPIVASVVVLRNREKSAKSSHNVSGKKMLDPSLYLDSLQRFLS